MQIVSLSIFQLKLTFTGTVWCIHDKLNTIAFTCGYFDDTQPASSESDETLILRCLFWCVPICSWIQIHGSSMSVSSNPDEASFNGQTLVYKCYWMQFTPGSLTSYWNCLMTNLPNSPPFYNFENNYLEGSSQIYLSGWWSYYYWEIVGNSWQIFDLHIFE